MFRCTTRTYGRKICTQYIIVVCISLIICRHPTSHVQNWKLKCHSFYSQGSFLSYLSSFFRVFNFQVIYISVCLYVCVCLCAQNEIGIAWKTVVTFEYTHAKVLMKISNCSTVFHCVTCSCKNVVTGYLFISSHYLSRRNLVTARYIKHVCIFPEFNGVMLLPFYERIT